MRGRAVLTEPDCLYRLLMCGVEWVIEAHGCVPSALAQLEKLEALFAYLIASMDLHPVGRANWHQFPVTGGVTGGRRLHLPFRLARGERSTALSGRSSAFRS